MSIVNKYLLAGGCVGITDRDRNRSELCRRRRCQEWGYTIAAKTEAKAGGDLTSPEKLMVGTWRGDHSGKITFNADGTYREFPTWLSVPTPPNPNMSTAQNAHGTWNFDQHDLVITWHVDQPVELPNGQLQPVTAEFQRHYKIARLDGSFLRLIVVDDNGNQMAAVFYRRLGDVTSLDQLKDKVPAEVLQRGGIGAHGFRRSALAGRLDEKRSATFSLAGADGARPVGGPRQIGREGVVRFQR